MKVIFSIILCLITNICFAQLGRYFSFGGSSYSSEEREISKIKERVLVESFRSPKIIKVKPKQFKKIYDEQLENRYYVKIENNSIVDIVEIYNYAENYNPAYNRPMVVTDPTLDSFKIPKMANMRIIKKMDESEYIVEYLNYNDSYSDTIYLYVPEGLSFKYGQFIEYPILRKPENKDIFIPVERTKYYVVENNLLETQKKIANESISVNRDSIYTDETKFKHESTYYKEYTLNSYQLVLMDEYKTWRKATAKELFLEYKNGKEFLVKLKTYKTGCLYCDKTGIDKEKYNEKLRAINNIREDSSVLGPSKKMAIIKLNNNKPKCYYCKGRKYLLLDEFYKLNFNTENQDLK